MILWNKPPVLQRNTVACAGAVGRGNLCGKGHIQVTGASHLLYCVLQSHLCVDQGLVGIVARHARICQPLIGCRQIPLQLVNRHLPKNAIDEGDRKANTALAKAWFVCFTGDESMSKGMNTYFAIRKSPITQIFSLLRISPPQTPGFNHTGLHSPIPHRQSPPLPAHRVLGFRGHGDESAPGRLPGRSRWS
jgi:hypothetical protein